MEENFLAENCMISLFKYFSKTNTEDREIEPVLVDMHSHLLPGLDDGSESLKDSIILIKEFIAMGYKKLICTPHIMGDFYKNTPEIIFEKLEELRNEVKKEGIEIQLEAAAEYYLDEWFMDRLDNKKNLLAFGGGEYLLFETSYINSSAYLNEALFKIKSLGLKPVLAHPERYTYLYENFNKFVEIYEKEVFFQININSLCGYYSKASQIFAQKLIENNMVTFIGSDCHGIRHIEALKKSRATKQYRKLLQSPLLNNSLL
jgi:protein-tyrosine phosphatase